MSTPAGNPYLTLPLHGVRSIEASAGTGKTFTLATLVLRLVVERRLPIGQILAVTFTEAATQELRARIRARLLLALTVIDAHGAAVDETSEAVATREVLEAWLQQGGESREQLRRRLRDAVDGIDLAAIFTIHGFCARVLREHALESGQGFDAPELLANDRHLREEIAADLWRMHATGSEDAEDLLALWPRGPEALAEDLLPLLRERALLPPDEPLPADPRPTLRNAGKKLIKSVRTHGETFHDAIMSAIEGKVINGNSFRVTWVKPLFAELDAWALQGNADAPFANERLGNLTDEFLSSKTNKGKDAHRPRSPLCKAIADHVSVTTEIKAYLEARRVQLLHRIRDEARTRLAVRKQQLRVQTFDDLIDRVADGLAGPRADALAQRLRQQYQVALVDEFQDTDPRQWLIFDRVFGAGSAQPALFLIGDPKQAIYGFRGGDVETYLVATKDAEKAPPLDRNFRSRPGVLKAVEALYTAAGEQAFVTDDIKFRAVLPGGVRSDDDFRDGRKAAPALTIWQAPPPEPDDDGKVKPHNANTARELATDACVAEIHRLLGAARKKKATIGGRALQPGDIAVLVRAHHEATRIRDALAAVGIPAVAAGRLSLFATDEARELHALLLALLHSADDGRLRTALSSVLLGSDAAGIAALDGDGTALHDARLRALAWRERLHRGGVLALVGDLCAEHAARLIGLLDGERRLSNYLQLAELLQEAQPRTLGLAGLIDWLARAIADADGNDEAQLLRLESDARRVQVVTLHKSKGLEYPLVFLPYAGIGGKARSAGRHVTVGSGEARTLHWRLQEKSSGWEEAEERWRQAQKAEDARLLYVGLTRASHALWLATGEFYNHKATALSSMLGDVQALAGEHQGTIVLDKSKPAADLPWLAPDEAGAVAPPRQAQRYPGSDWWIYSFTQLRHADAGHTVMAAATDDAGAASDEPAQGGVESGSAGAQTAQFAGARFGNALHAALEMVDFAAWATWCEGDPPPATQQALLLDALRDEGYAASDLDPGAELLGTLVGRTLTATLPEGGALHSLPAHDRRAEIEFHFALAPTAVPELIALLHAHGIVLSRRGFGLRQRLEGLMTGKIDLTYVRDQRWYVLDYKSNRLPAYDAAALAEAMAHSEYDLQALLYTLALHRWLRFRLGDGYDYARDVGGIRYLFCRGMDAAGTQGIHAQRFAPALVHALDALFAGTAAAAAAAVPATAKTGSGP